MAKGKVYSKAEEVVSYRPKPTLSLDAKDLPAIKDWKVGKSYKIEVTAKMVSMSEGNEYDYEDEDRAKQPMRARFQITSAKEYK